MEKKWKKHEMLNLYMIKYYIQEVLQLMCFISLAERMLQQPRKATTFQGQKYISPTPPYHPYKKY